MSENDNIEEIFGSLYNNTSFKENKLESLEEIPEKYTRKKSDCKKNNDLYKFTTEILNNKEFKDKYKEFFDNENLQLLVLSEMIQIQSNKNNKLIDRIKNTFNSEFKDLIELHKENCNSNTIKLEEKNNNIELKEDNNMELFKKNDKSHLTDKGKSNLQKELKKRFEKNLKSSQNTYNNNKK